MWRDPKFKEAFLRSIDRQAYVDTILQGYGVVRNSPMDGSPYACPTMVKYDYDPEKADALFTELGYPKEKRAEITIDLMSWLGIKPRLDYLPIAQEAMRKMGFKSNVDLIDNALIDDYLTGKGPRGKDWDIYVLLYGAGADPQQLAFVADPTSQTNAGVWGWPAPAAEGLKEGWKYENQKVLDLFAQTAKETDPDKRTELFQQIDCEFNKDIPFFETAAPSFILAKSSRLQGVDWATGASLGTWMNLYKPGDFWLWLQK